MQLRKSAGHGLLAMTLISVTTVVMAQKPPQKPPFYAGVGLGYSKQHIGSGALGITGATATTMTRDEETTGAKIFAGYHFTPGIAMELGYVDLGKASATRTMTAPAAGTVSANTRNTGWFADLVGSVPLGAGNFALLGRLGRVSSLSAKNISSTGAVAPVPGASTSPSERETNWKYGTGAQYEISKDMLARAEWERYHRLGKDTGLGEQEADLYSLNLLYRFK